MIHNFKICKRVCSCAPHSANIKEKNIEGGYCTNLAMSNAGLFCGAAIDMGLERSINIGWDSSVGIVTG
jgi:hypothetical protein